MPGRKAVSGSKAAAAEKSENQSNQNVEKEQSDSKAPIEAKVGKAADGTVEKSEGKNPPSSKSGRGRPKKAEGEQPVAKKPKLAKVPSRVSQRVSNQMKGIKLPDPQEDLLKKAPRKRNSKKPEKSSKNTTETEDEREETSNGATEQAVES